MSDNKSGWIRISRSIEDHWIFQDANRLKWWLDLLLMASWEEKKITIGNRLVVLQRGQMIASISFLMKRWDVGNHAVIDFLKMLIQDGMLHKSSHNNISILTICNYDSYQAPSGISLHNPPHNLLHDLAHNLNDYKSISNESLLHNPPHNLLHTNKEYNNIYNNINISPTTDAHAREESFFEDLKSNKIFQEQAVCMKFRLTEEEYQKRVEDFKSYCLISNKIHENLEDVRLHFMSWLEIRINKEKNQRNNETKSNNADRRRGFEVTATSAEDYSTTF